METTDNQQPTRSRRRLLVSLLVLAVVVSTGSLTVLGLIQRKLIYQPTRVQSLSPIDSGFTAGNCLQVTIESEPGILLHGWHVLPPNRQALDAEEQQAELDLGRPVVLIFPGNAGHRGYRAVKMRLISDLSADVFLFDYRGYAENQGSPSEKAVIRDAKAIWAYLVDDLEIAPGRILVLGESLGGGVATGLASQLADKDVQPGGLFLKATFCSLLETAQYHFPWLPVGSFLIDRFPSEERIQKITCPITMIHGRADDIVPFRLGRKLFEAAPDASSSGVKKQFVELPGIGHNNILLDAQETYLESLDEMLSRIRQET